MKLRIDFIWEWNLYLPITRRRSEYCPKLLLRANQKNKTKTTKNPIQSNPRRNNNGTIIDKRVSKVEDNEIKYMTLSDKTDLTDSHDGVLKCLVWLFGNKWNVFIDVWSSYPSIMAAINNRSNSFQYFKWWWW